MLVKPCIYNTITSFYILIQPIYEVLLTVVFSVMDLLDSFILYSCFFRESEQRVH